jgi:hypothetical protein
MTPDPYWHTDGITLHAGDCLDILATMPDNSVDAIVTDPPYGLEFMGKDWDSFASQTTTARVQRGEAGGFGDDPGKPWNKARSGTSGPRSTFKCRKCGGWSGSFSDARRARQKQCMCEAPDYDYAGAPTKALAFGKWCHLWTTEALRVLKPGAHLLAFGGTRTFHRLACAIEDAGFEIRDSIGYGHTERPGLLAWMTGSGFPKSSRVNKDARFCRCVSSGHTSSHTSLGQRPDGHTRTEDDAGPAERGGRSVRRETRTAQGSPVDCRSGCDCGDEPPHLGLMADLVGLPSRECARGRSRSVALEGGLADGSSHSPSQALHIGRPSSRDFGVLADSETGESENTRRSTSPADTFGSVHRKLDSSQGPSPVEYSNAFPVCTSCGKPNADGLGTSLKPAWEPIVCARKPLVGTLAQNVLTYGTGALNVDGCRIDGGPRPLIQNAGGKAEAPAGGFAGKTGSTSLGTTTAGRWPANVVLDGGYPGSAADTLDEQTGISCSSVRKPSGKDERGIPNTASSVVVRRNDTQPRGVADSGGASRFFKVVHASPADHDPGGPDPFAAPFVPWRYEAKAPTSERPRVPGEPGVPVLRLREDLTDEERAHVLTELQRAGVDITGEDVVRGA